MNNQQFATRKQEQELTAWIIRKFPEGQVPAEQAQYLIEHPEELPALLLAMVARGMVTTPIQLTAAVTEWQKLFGHLRVWDSNFNESHFPLEPESDLRPVDHVHQFDVDVIGFNALQRLDDDGFELSLPRAVGLYLKEHTLLQKEKPLIGGGRWASPGGNLYAPVFGWDGGKPDVSLGWLGREFGLDYGWLVSRKKQS